MAVLTSTHNLCFGSKIRKNRYTPVNPNFAMYKWGSSGFTCHRHVFLMIKTVEAKKNPWKLKLLLNTCSSVCFKFQSCLKYAQHNFFLISTHLQLLNLLLLNNTCSSAMETNLQYSTVCLKFQLPQICSTQFERPRGKTNNVVSEQVGHKPACTSTEKS